MTAATHRIASEFTISCENLVHIYGAAGSEVTALQGVDLNVRAGEMLALLGPSGSGKSTLLWHLAGLLRPTAGTVRVGGQDLAALSARQLVAFREREIGVVLQNSGRNLLPYVSALDNVSLVRRSGLTGVPEPRELIDAVGISGLAHRAAGRMSGGEKQRLAVAVALANAPSVLLADEPTSQLDAASAHDVVALIHEVNARFGTTVIMVTHDVDTGSALGRTIMIRDGRIGATGISGQELLVVGRDGSVQLPPDVVELLPPGSLVHVERLSDGVVLRHADVEQELP